MGSFGTEQEAARLTVGVGAHGTRDHRRREGLRDGEAAGGGGSEPEHGAFCEGCAARRGVRVQGLRRCLVARLEAKANKATCVELAERALCISRSARHGTMRHVRVHGTTGRRVRDENEGEPAAASRRRWWRGAGATARPYGLLQAPDLKSDLYCGFQINCTDSLI